ncbi:phosphatase 1E [Paramuricea clavata]|nr:phosphatase 1E [Paramuricea clavata]
MDRKVIKAYNCGKLAITTVNAVHEVCKEWKSNMPKLMKSKYVYEIYMHSEQNTRRRMEDKHIVLTEFNNLCGLDKDFPSQAFFAVYDGHGGIDCACYTIAHFHNNIAKQKTFSSDLDDALRKAFLTTDKLFLEKAKNENLRAGTTSVVALLRDNTLHIGWLGDSQISMCKQGRAVKLMEPHKPNRKDERQRIEELGGCVIWIGDWRVNGNIAVSRSIGDKDHKPYVSADPDTLEFDLEGDEEYLILGCDGLWDTIQPPNVIEMVQEHLAGGGARSQVAKFLVERAIAHGSTDNITVVVVFLDCHRTEKDPETSMDVGEVEGTGDEKVPETPAAEGTAKETGDEKAPETAAAEGATKETGDEKTEAVP